MKSIVIFQARTNSSRLPGKVLLPVRGVPLVILAVRRASNTGRSVIVATSNESTDDALSDLLYDAGISCFRGSLENTLQRFVGALEGYSDDTLVFRLTADNVFPDGVLLDEMEEEFLRRDLKYLCCNGAQSGLPYGMSAELTRAGFLREAAKSSTSQHDLEHVTPYLRREYGETYFERYRDLRKGHFRCTVDCLDDFQVIQHVFSKIPSPEYAPALELINLLPNAPYQPFQAVPARKLVLGTAQLGMMYGINNQSGKPNQAIAETIIKAAIANGVTYLDTARAYGDSEEVIGNALRSGWQGRVQIITKLSPLSDCPPDAKTSIVNAFVDASIFRSCSALRTQKLDVLMLHRASDLVGWSGAVVARLLQHKAEDRLTALGISVQSPDELAQALLTPEIEFIQMPFNVLDWRWDTLIPFIKQAKRQRRITFHIRSALLQGLLLSNKAEHWLKANVTNPEAVMQWLESQSRTAGRSSVADYCLNYVKSLDWVDGIVVGTESLEQLSENIQILCSPELSLDQLHYNQMYRPKLEETTLNPASWRN